MYVIKHITQIHFNNRKLDGTITICKTNTHTLEKKINCQITRHSIIIVR